jgi:hypothetical protein
MLIGYYIPIEVIQFLNSLTIGFFYNSKYMQTTSKNKTNYKP